MGDKTVLVTGGAGYVGSHVAKALSVAGFSPVVLDNLSRGFQSAVQWGPLIQADINDNAAVVKALKDHKPCGVIHLAGYAYVQESVQKPLLYFHNNVGGSESLLSAMVEAGVQNIVFSSTCSLYGESDVTPLNEDVLPDPINPYAQSKLMIEHMLKAAQTAYGLRFAALRYFNAAGADPDGDIGENHDPETHLIPLVLQVAAGLRSHVEIFGDTYPTPDGSAVRDYVHVSDLAVAHVAALRHLLEGGESLTLNLANGQGSSVKEVVDVVRAVTKKPVKAIVRPPRPGDPAILIGDASRAKRWLKWTPQRSSLDVQVSDAWRWMCQSTS